MTWSRRFGQWAHRKYGTFWLEINSWTSPISNNCWRKEWNIFNFWEQVTSSKNASTASWQDWPEKKILTGRQRSLRLENKARCLRMLQAKWASTQRFLWIIQMKFTSAIPKKPKTTPVTVSTHSSTVRSSNCPPCRKCFNPTDGTLCNLAKNIIFYKINLLSLTTRTSFHTNETTQISSD